VTGKIYNDIFNTGTTYHAVVECTDSSGTQTEPIGHAETDVTF
jgi:hypothetical protein